MTNAFLTALYIVAIGTFMFYAGQMKLGRNNQFLAPIALLLLFVCSAAITGYLMFGRPAQLYVDGKKKEALTMVSYTLGTFAAITFIFLLLLFIFVR